MVHDLSAPLVGFILYVLLNLVLHHNHIVFGHWSAQMDIRCQSCRRRLRDDETVNYWTYPHPLPNGTTYIMCHACLKSPRKPWLEIFKLVDKASLGHGQYDRSATVQEIPDEVGCRGPVSTHSTEAETTYDHGDAQNSAPFEYPPLGTDDIRLITLLPGSGAIVCRMEVRSLDDDSLDFAALSYHWGSSAPDQENQVIWVGSRPLPVSKNLLEAMQGLRHPSKERKLWVDAICINQAVAAEKEQQLPLMSRIYSQALGVIVWLGPCEDDSDFVMEGIEQGHLERMNSDRFVLGIAKLWRRPWFSRTWVVQEYVLGRPRIFCGQRSVSATRFYATYWFLRAFVFTKRLEATRTREQINMDSSAGGPTSMDSETVVSDAALRMLEPDTALSRISGLARMVVDHDDNSRPRNLARALRQCRTLKATNPKDEVYGTLGLVEKSVFQHIPIDYGDATSAADVYSSAMAYIIGVTKDVEAIDLFALLPMPLSTNQPMPNLPSWVPDFSSKTPPLIDAEVLKGYIRYHTSSVLRGTLPTLEPYLGLSVLKRDPIQASVEGHRLITRGFIVDEIQDLVSSTFFTRWDTMRDHVKSWAEGSDPCPGGLSQSAWRFTWSLYEGFDLVSRLNDLTKMYCSAEELDAISALSTVFGLKLSNKFRYVALIQVDTMCRKKFTELNISVPADEWITSVWSDLLEGIPSLGEGDLTAQFHDLAGSSTPVDVVQWLESPSASESLGKREFKDETWPLYFAMQSVFDEGRKFFVGRSTEIYGIGMPTIREGDKIVFLFPPIYMACILRPLGGQYQIVGPAIVPFRLREKYIRQCIDSRRAPQWITLV